MISIVNGLMIFEKRFRNMITKNIILGYDACDFDRI